MTRMYDKYSPIIDSLTADRYDALRMNYVINILEILDSLQNNNKDIDKLMIEIDTFFSEISKNVSSEKDSKPNLSSYIKVYKKYIVPISLILINQYGYIKKSSLLIPIFFGLLIDVPLNIFCFKYNFTPLTTIGFLIIWYIIYIIKKKRGKVIRI